MRGYHSLIALSLLHTAHLPITVDIEIDETSHSNVHVIRDHSFFVTLFPIVAIGIIGHFEDVDDIGLVQTQQM